MLYKSELVIAIAQTIVERGLSQTKAAEVVGVDQPTLSKLLRGRTMSFSVDRLCSMLNELGQDVDITIRRHQGEEGAKGRVTVSVATVM